MTTIILETERPRLKSMIDTEHLNYSINQHMKRLKEHSDSKDIMKLFQLMGQYSVKTGGYSFMSNKTMAKEIGKHPRTIQRHTKLMEKLNIILKVPTNRKHNRGQTSNTYVILPVIKSVVSRVCHGVCHAFNPSFKPLKQENNNIHTQSNIEKSELKETLMKIAEYKINDIIEMGVIVNSPSSYVMKVFKNEIRKAEAKERLREDKLKRQQQRQPQQRKEPLPFYNWLES